MIYILGLNIRYDISTMKKKILDINLISEDENEFTFFNIDDEEANEILKALKKTYVTSNSKEETILKLKHKSTTSKDLKHLKLESYKKYNEALNMLEKDFINSASDIVDEALELNPKDIDILNLKGLIKLLKCEFDQAFESFYKSLCYSNNNLSKKYVSILSSEDFSIFLSRYNHAIRFINKELNQESIQIFENITNEEPDLIEPFLLLYLIYNKLGDDSKSNEYLNILKEIDKDNPMFETKVDVVSTEEIKPNEKAKSNKSKYIYISIILCLVIGLGLIYNSNKNKIEKLNSKINEKEEKINETKKELNKANDELEEIKNKEEVPVEAEIIVADEVELSNKASELKKEGNIKEALKYYKLIVENGKTKKYLSESIYQAAYLNEKLKNYEEAIKYYKKYINTYTKSENYYDDSFYNMGMIYYNNGDLESAKKVFYGLRAEDPDSMYNNSKIKNILKEK